MTDDVRIDRIVLELPGLSLAEARELAASVGEGLCAADGHHDRLSVELEWRPGEPNRRLAARIVSQLLRRIG
jgi:hypothetical protein